MHFKIAGLFFVALLTLPVQAQNVSATGTALGADAKPIPNAKVTYKSKDGKVEASATTDKNGSFQVNVAGGQDYEMTVEAEGLIPFLKSIAKEALTTATTHTLPPASLEDAVGLVLDAQRKPVAKAKVTLKSGESQTTVVATNDKGEFTAKVPTQKLYDIKVEAEGYSPVTLQMKREGLHLVQVVLAKSNLDCCTGQASSPGVILFCLIVYWSVAVLARYHNIVKVDRAMITASMEALSQDVSVAPESIKGRAKALLLNAKTLLEDSFLGRVKSSVLGFSGEEVAARMNLCDAKLALAETYTRDQTIAALRLTVETLRPEYSNMAAKVEATLAATGADEPSTEFLRATLITALRCEHQKSELAFIGVMNWQNKAFALIFLGCCLLAAMAVALDNPILIFLGLLGGFASRLMRGKTTASTDGSLSWTTILLSPLYGGFAGWAGILILSGAKELKLVGEVFYTVVWGQASCSSLALGLAFLFGFSERFFSAVTDMAENAVTKQKNASAADSPENKPPTSDPKIGVTATTTAAAITGATLAADKQTLTLVGTNLKAVKEVKLKGVADALTIVTATQTSTQIEAKSANPLVKGTYSIVLDGKEVAKSIDVP